MANYTDSLKRVWGNKDMKKVTVDSSSNLLTVTLSTGEWYDVTIPSKTYAWDDVPRISELVDKINEELTKLNVTMACMVGGVSKDTKYDCLVFKPTDDRDIVSLTGTFSDKFFN